MASAAHTINLTTAELNHIILWSYPSITGQVIILLEAFRTLLAEWRMWKRIWKRKRFNAAEIMFMAIKYFAILGYVCDAVVRASTLIKSDQGCYNVHFVSLFAIFFATSLVALAIAWRTYIIFQCRRRVYWILFVALCIQFGLSMSTMSVQYKYNVLQDGYCITKHTPSYFLKVPPHKLLLPWYLLYNGLFDLCVTAAATRHLVKTMGAPYGVSEVGRVLFQNNVHYAIVVCTANLGLSILFWSIPHKLPTLMPVSGAIQIICGLNLLASEQDLVHRPAGSRVSHASPGGKELLPTSSPSSGGGSFQSSSKVQTSTFQSEMTNGGSPLLLNVWDKKMSQEDLKKTPPVITFEQDRIKYYDDPATPTGKKLQRPSFVRRLKSPLKKENGVFYTMQDDSEKQAYSLSTSTINSTFLGATLPSPTQTREGSKNKLQDNDITPTKSTFTSSPQKLESSFSPSIPAAVASLDSMKEYSTISTTPPSGGISIRSIRANLESPPRINGAFNSKFETDQILHRPQTSPSSPSHPRELGSSPTLASRRAEFGATLDYVIPSQNYSFAPAEPHRGTSNGDQRYPSLRHSPPAPLRSNTSGAIVDLDLTAPNVGTFASIAPATHSPGLRRPTNPPPVASNHSHYRGPSVSSFGSASQINPLLQLRAPSFSDTLQDGESEIDHSNTSTSSEMSTISYVARSPIDSLIPQRPNHPSTHL